MCRYRSHRDERTGILTWVERLAASMRLRAMTRLRLAVALGGALLLAGCSSSGPAQSSDEARRCGPSDLTVTMSSTDGTVRAANTGGHECVLSGTSPVSVPWWRVVGPSPVAPTGRLAKGSVLVQEYVERGGNGCPAGGMNRDKTALLPITVEGHTYAIPMSADQAYQIEICDAVSAGEPRVEPMVSLDAN